MAKPPGIRRLRTEDFSPEDRQLVERISYSINDFLDQVVFLFTNGIDFLNLNQSLKKITITTDSSGNLAEDVVISTDLKSKAVGGVLISLENNTNSDNLPSFQPFIKITPTSQSKAKLSGLTGLEPSSEYSITVLIIGENI